jgi:N12 class adenine-specific DNA methylase/adenine-specific DNA methylase
MPLGATATQLSFDLFTTTALATGFTLDAGGVSRPPPQAAPALTQRFEPRRAEPPIVTGGDFQLTGDRALAASWRERALDNLAAIRLAHELGQAGRPATPDEQRRLIRFTGFGASDLANSCFLRPGESGFRPGWEAIGADLRSAVAAEEYAALARCTQYAHYTPEWLVRSIWQALIQMGFQGGRILEPGLGTGLFLALMPETVRKRSRATGIELDPVTAGIARLLYPLQDIRNADFAKIELPPTFDLAIGNPPFSDRIVQSDPAYKGMGLRLHDYFIVKALDALRPGGLAAFVTSHGTMDKRESAVRERISASADLLAAIRLPEGAFRATAGTDVVTDVLFFQKRDASEASHGQPWEGLTMLATPSGDIAINRYFAEHPDMVLGEHQLRRGIYGPALIYSCAPRPGCETEAELSRVVKTLSSELPGRPPSFTEAVQDDLKAEKQSGERIGTAADGALLKEGSFFIGAMGALMQIVNGTATPVPVKTSRQDQGIQPKPARIIRGLIPIRDAVRQILRAQEADRPWTEGQQRLRVSYATFVRNFGAINLTTITTLTDAETGEVRETHRRPNLSPFLDDPDCWLVSSIEEYDLESGIARHGAIFTERVIAPPAPAVIESAADALAVVLNETGSVDPARIAALLGREESEVLAELGDTVFRNPETQAWETADAYLSGAVRTRLRAATVAAALDPAFGRNVEALTRVQPEDLPPSAITARLGAPWVPADDVALFALQVMQTETAVTHTEAVACWSVETWRFAGTAAGTTEWGTSRRNAGELLEDALNARIPQIYDSWRDENGEHRELNVQATEAAKEKLARIKEAFSTWIWTDPDRTDRLARLYNDRFNNLVPRHFDGGHLTLPSTSRAIRFYDHQKRVIWRVIAAGSTYIAHAVGAGKTYSIAAALMEQKRLGLIAKPLLVVPGHCLAQASREFLALYPNGRILVADETNFVAAKRQRFLARAATEKWDAIIITHSAFKLIPAPAAFERSMIEDEIAEYEALLVDLKGDGAGLTRKRVERMKEGLQDRLEGLRSRKDNMLTIAEIGVDQIVVDEAQEFRKLSFTTNTVGLKGVDPDGSQRAWDLYVKARFLETKRPGRALILASGTPITNTLGEMFTIQRFMQPAALKERGVHAFDAWASSFGDTVTELELQPSGLYKPVTRFAEFVNVPELIAMFRSFADVVQKQDLRHLLKLPRLKTGQRQLLTAAPSPAFKLYQQHLAERIKAIEARSGRPQPGDDILLSVITDGRHAAIDLRLVGPAGDEPENKLNLLIQTVHRVWQETAESRHTRLDGRPYQRPGAGQLVFSDLGTIAVEATRGFSAYRWIKESLVRLGVPASDIAFMQDFKKSEAKQRLFNDFNAGRVRVLIGSSETMGTGVNVQRRLKALHHLDVPWLPSQIEQREGRIERQGNEHEEIELYAYATLGSMDATMWQNNERKARFIAAALAGDRSVRRLEDAGNQANQFAMAKAIASGDHRLMQKAGLESEIARLRRLQAAHIDDQHAIRRSIQDASAAIRRAEQRIAGGERDIALRDASAAASFALTIAGHTIRDRKAAGAALLAAIKGAVGERAQTKLRLAEFRGFPIRFEPDTAYGSGKLVYDIVLARGGYDQETGINLGFTAERAIARLEEMLDGFEAEIATQRQRIADETRRLQEFEARIGQEFPLASELALKRDELARIEADLAATTTSETADQSPTATMPTETLEAA